MHAILYKITIYTKIIPDYPTFNLKSLLQNCLLPIHVLLIFSILLPGKTVVQSNQIKSQVVQSPVQQPLIQQQPQMTPTKTVQQPQTQQQIILKQTPQLVQKQPGIVVGNQVMPQQIVLSTNQIVTNQNGQQVLHF